ncbi:hypothetical protein [Picrophilus oshimae]|uniref:Uncharacterized protein n=1 Tax=Picrophilus torridus (strain ATCC 700027 / DSM 9790 / JCM 10055 / NBRC 100828 / KAW 2/3) TaxID=1122961 RepID=A0A8G2FXS5_PICTO|nr:hypothetical protein [Picrophilus oshimae]SMD31445.1 hypothetical protein SAMN02745355_1386 [Picrophilus oshimae DSM 9789]
MNISDIDKKLDYKCKFSYNVNISIGRLSEIYKNPITVFIKNDGKNHYIRAYVPKTDDKNIMEMMNFFDYDDFNNYYRIIQNMYSESQYKLIEELGNIRSVVFSETDLENGMLTVRFRFSSRYRKEITDILSKYMIRPNVINNIKITPSEGIKWLIGNKNKRTRLSVLSYDVPLSIHNNDYVSEFMMNHDSIAEVLDAYSVSNKFKMLVYTNDEMRESNDVHKIDDGIYEAFVENRMLQAVREAANDAGIFRDHLFIKVDKDSINLTVILSYYRIDEYLRILFSESYNLTGQNIVSIRYIGDYQDYVFDII